MKTLPTDDLQSRLRINIRSTPGCGASEQVFPGHAQMYLDNPKCKTDSSSCVWATASHIAMIQEK